MLKERMKDRRMPPRFWRKIEVDEAGCWIWTGARSMRGGYGRMRLRVSPEKEYKYAHRAAYERLVGLVPDGMVLDHLCKKPACVNPDHLEIVTPNENNYRSDSWGGRNARKTHCKHGHAFTPENIHYTKTGRSCKTCQREYMRVRRGHGAQKPPLPQRSHCLHGHIVTPDSIRQNRQGSWICRVCAQDYQLRRKLRQSKRT